MATRYKNKCPQCDRPKMITSNLCGACRKQAITARNTVIAKEKIAYRTRVPEPMECAHFWDIEDALGAKSWGRCRYCRDGMIFSNSFPEGDKGNSITLQSAGGDGMLSARILAGMSNSGGTW